MIRNARAPTARRRGKTLIELVVVVSLTSIVLSLAATTLVALYRIERQTRATSSQGQTLCSLASRLRQDAHAAQQATVAGGCELALADGRRIRYVAGPQGILREVTRGSAVEHRDTFALAAPLAAEFQLAPVGQRSLVTLAIRRADRPARLYAPAVPDLTIAAAVNLAAASSAEKTP